MSITVLRGKKQIAPLFDPITKARAAPQKNGTLLLSGETLIDPIRIDVRHVTLVRDRHPVEIGLCGVSRFDLVDGAKTVLRTEGVNPAVVGGSERAQADLRFVSSVGPSSDNRDRALDGEKISFGLTVNEATPRVTAVRTATSSANCLATATSKQRCPI